MTALNWDHLNKIFPFGRSPMLLEAVIAKMAREYSEDYTGGCWTIRNVGTIMFVVPPEGSYNVSAAGNYYSGTMDANTFGAALTLMLFNRLLWEAADKGAAEVNKLSDLYYKMLRAARRDKLVNASELNAFLD
jgi:Antirestriction protein